jgi:hypothetical protein
MRGLTKEMGNLGGFDTCLNLDFHKIKKIIKIILTGALIL